jgi:hypothetical protein
MNISFIFCNPKQAWKQPGSWLIRKLDRSSASHVAICVQLNHTKYIFESVSPKSRVIELSAWSKEYNIEYSFDFKVPELKRWAVLNYLENIIDKPYSYGQLILIGLTNLFMPFQLLLRGAILNHERALICTEVISLMVEKFMNYDIKKKHDQHGISDIDLMAIELAIQQNPWKE